jgi:GT2 family glycosyltransferase
MKPSVSVIVVAPELGEYAHRCLARLLELEPGLEVIFVPDEAPADLDSRVRCVPSGPGRTAGEKRQLGLEHATGELIALIDDDAYPHRSWLDVARAVFAEDAAIGAVAGPTLTPADDSELEQLGGRVFASALVSGPERWRYVPLPARDVDDAPSVNFLMRREHAVTVGLSSGDRWGEDTLVCDRLRERGLRIRYDPSVVVFHSRRPLWRPHLRQLYRWSRHRSAYAREAEGSSRNLAYFAPSSLLLFAAGGWLLPRTRRAWKAAMLSYAVACIAAGADRNPSRWWRLSAAIAATHATYGAGFLLGIAGRRPPGRWT